VGPHTELVELAKVPCFLAYCSRFSFRSSRYRLLCATGSNTVTITTGGVPDGALSRPPMIFEMRNINPPIVARHSTRNCILERRSSGPREERGLYIELCGDDFFGGSAKCMACLLA